MEPKPKCQPNGLTQTKSETTETRKTTKQLVWQNFVHFASLQVYELMHTYINVYYIMHVLMCLVILAPNMPAV